MYRKGHALAKKGVKMPLHPNWSRLQQPRGKSRLPRCGICLREEAGWG